MFTTISSDLIAEPLELPEPVRGRLADEVIGELLAGARTEEEIVGPGRCARAVDPE